MKLCSHNSIPAFVAHPDRAIWVHTIPPSQGSGAHHGRATNGASRKEHNPVCYHGAVANDGRLSDLVWIEEQRMREPARLLSTDTARLITSFLSDPLARLPSFPRYGPF